MNLSCSVVDVKLGCAAPCMELEFTCGGNSRSISSKQAEDPDWSPAVQSAGRQSLNTHSAGHSGQPRPPARHLLFASVKPECYV